MSRKRKNKQKVNSTGESLGGEPVYVLNGTPPRNIGRVVKPYPRSITESLKLKFPDNSYGCFNLLPAFYGTPLQLKTKDQELKNIVESLKENAVCNRCGAKDVPLFPDGRRLICQNCKDNLAVCSRCGRHVTKYRIRHGAAGEPDLRICLLCLRKEYISKLGGRSYYDCDTFNFADESPLHALGYNVSDKDSLSPSQRREILKDAIRLGIMSKRGIISWIENFYIGYIGRNPERAASVLAWRSDLEFLRRTEIEPENLD